MKISPALCALFMLNACAASAQKSDAPFKTAGEFRIRAEPAKQYGIEELMTTDSIGSLSFSPDNKRVLFSSLRTGLRNLYTIPVGGGASTAITSSTKETIGGIGYFPNDERIVFSSDQGGDERSHIYVREIDGRIVDVTPGTGHVARWLGWAQDKKSFYVFTNERDPRNFDLYEHSAANYSRKLIFQNDHAYQIEGVSADRRFIALSRIYDNARTDLLLREVETGMETTLTKEGGHVNGGNYVTFAPNGEEVLFPSMEGREFLALYRQNLSSGERSIVLAPEWDVNGASFTDDDKYLVASVNQNARSRPYVFDAKTYKLIDLGLEALEPEKNVGVQFARKGAPMALVMVSGGDTPGEIYLRNLKTGESRLLLNALPGSIAKDDLVRGQVIRFASYDGVMVPGVLSIPHGARKDAAMPAVIDVHGGPGGENRVDYDPLVQYLANHGYLVFEINNRGSSGSGKTFYHLDDHAHGDADLDDVVAAKEMLIETGYVDPDKVVILGQSYGGYMVLAGLTFRPEAFAAGVDIYGVANWPRLLKNTPPWWEDLRRLLNTEVGDPDTEEEYLKSISPYFHADKIVRPMLVLQGANDPRVLQQESDDIVAKARANGASVEYVVFPDEGHGFRKKANQIKANETILNFLDRYVKGEEEAQYPDLGDPVLENTQ